MRIIGGRWRGRKIRIAGNGDTRPTPARARETVFNWLAPRIEGAACLDLYAGSGALGFEALSRGAATVALVEADPGATAALRQNRDALRAAGAEIVRADALQWLRQGRHNPSGYDIVFLDPPFPSRLLARSCEALLDGGCLRAAAVIYTEAETEWAHPRLRTMKTARAGRVRYGLHGVCAAI